jgi:ABC-2 type transport system ATP-binding protein
VEVDLTPPAGRQVVGAPTLTFTYSGLGTSQAVFAQLVDNNSGLVLSNIVTPVPVTLDGKTRTVTIPMEAVVYTPDAGDTLTLQITGSAVNYLNAWTYGGVAISDVTVDLPQHIKVTPTPWTP